MNITRNTMRADGMTVGESMDLDSAEPRKLGFAAKDGAPPYQEAEEQFVERCRMACLDALDSLAGETAGNRELGPKDQELPALFAGIDSVAKRMFAHAYTAQAFHRCIASNPARK